ncbi:ATP-binding protein [Pseudidiomarina insulisalsae]|uniref:AAA+ ATPase domain-containing protein n=1 Tax=Pseudidiomarina insulisalsae TaxID=575789 RepID=A0A432YMP2_9GAMM|nr:AAA family ATPase [Pseudidiomarina insulisalsae]RUO62206.1 hypothetical protein CWI71_04980 [Pseudidiomarina insulisalsae]
MNDLYPSTPRDVQTIIRAQLELLWEQPELAQTIPPLMLWGAPGVGKSTVIRELCQKLGIEFIDIRLAQREPVDLRGLPVPKENHVEWLLASEWPRDPDSRGIILFDELSAADRTLQAAAYEIILDRRLGDLYTLPKGWLVMGAGNRIGDRAIAHSFSSALANRFCHLTLEPDIEQWCVWARQKGIDPLIIGFLKFAPEHFFNLTDTTETDYGWPSPRSWERAALMYSQAQRMDLNKQQQRIVINGLIGPGAAAAFFAYCESTEDLPDVPAMLRGEVPVEVPTSNDTLYAFCTSVSFHLWLANKRNYQKRLDILFKITRQLNSDFATMLMLDVMRDDSYSGDGERLHEQRAALIFGHPDYGAWIEQHGMEFGSVLETLV